MLQKNVVTEETYNVLKTLMNDKYLNDFLIDCIKYDYENLNDVETIDGIRMLSVEDVIAMKLVAIYQDGTRIKDFIDIAYLSNSYSLNEMIEFCNKKTNCDNSFSIMKGIVYFGNIDYTEKVKVYDENYSFEKIKKHLVKMSDNPNAIIKYDSKDADGV